MDDIERKLRDLGDRTAQELTSPGISRRRVVRRARLRRTAMLAAPVAGAVLLGALVYPNVGWGGRAGRDEPAFDLAAAARATEDAGTARIEVDMEMGLEGRTTAAHGSGAVDFDAQRLRFRIELEGAAGVHVMDLLMIGDKTFSRSEGERKWLVNELPGSAGAALFGGRPTEYLGWLERTAEDVEDLGTEVRDGVEVTHLRAVMLDPAFVTETYEIEPLDVWVDAHSRVREIEMRASFEGNAMSSTMRFSDFGIPVEIEAPPASETTTSIDHAVGVPEVTLVMGAAGHHSAAYVVVTRSPNGFDTACVTAWEGKPVRAVLVDEATREVVATMSFDVQGADGSEDDTGPQRGCPIAPVDWDDIEVLIDDPSRFTLRVVGDDGRRTLVRLAKSETLSDGTEAEE